MKARILTLLLAFALAAPASALEVRDWTPLPPQPVPEVLFAAADAPPVWAGTAEAPWYGVGEGLEPAPLRRGWVDFGKDDAPRDVRAATQLLLDGYGPLTLALRCDEAARLSLDGEPVLTLAPGDEQGAHTVDLPRGKVQLVVEVRARARKRARFRLEADAPAGLAVTRDARRGLARFADTRLLPSVPELALSPDGARLLVRRAFRDADGSRRSELAIHNLDSGRSAVVARGDLNDVGWLTADRFRYREGGAVVVRDIQGRWHEPQLGDVEHLVRYDLGNPAVYLTDPGQEPLGDPARLTELRRRLTDWSDRAVLRVRRGVSPLAPDAPLTAAGDFHVVDFAVDRAATPPRVALVRKVPIDVRPFFVHEIWTTDVAGAAPRLLATVRTGFEIWPMNLAWSPDGARLAYTANANDVGDGQPERNWARTDVWVLDVATGEARNLTAGEDFAPQDRRGDAIVWLDDDTLAVPVLEGHAGALALIDAAGGATRLLRHEIAGLRATVAAATVAPAAGRAAWVADTWHDGPRVVVADLADGSTRELDIIGDPVLELARAEPFVFRNAAGDSIDGWWYRPLRPAAEPWPLIVYYYGGALSTLGGVNGTHQWLAANGYAVYVLNPRGAHTYGRAFADAHVNDWGEKAGADVLAGVDALLAAHPELDPARVGCFGGSFGGFLTMHLLTRTDRFAAAVSLYGISDLASYWGEGVWGVTYGDMALARSYPWNRPDLFTDRSPLYRADRIRTPLLLLHGAADLNVPPGESEQMFAALRTLGREVELVRFAGEDHGISGTWENRVAHRTMLLEWFDRWLRDEPAAWNARWGTEEER